MNVLDAIKSRRSTRAFVPAELSRDQICQIVCGGMQAPSPKNAQPWSFVVVQDAEKKNHIAQLLEANLRQLKRENDEKNIARPDLDSAFMSARILREASAVIFVFLEESLPVAHDDKINWRLHARDVECTYIMAIGAAIENMLLTATSMGISSLWMCDVYYAYQDIVNFLDKSGVMLAAVALGYGESDGQVHRKHVSEAISWK